MLMLDTFLGSSTQVYVKKIESEIRFDFYIQVAYLQAAAKYMIPERHWMNEHPSQKYLRKRFVYHAYTIFINTYTLISSTKEKLIKIENI